MLEFPALDQFADEAAVHGVRVISINVKGQLATVRRLTASSRITTLLDPSATVADRYNVSVQPYTVVITDSTVSARFAGTKDHVRFLDALRAATHIRGGAVTARAGMDWRRKDRELVLEEGEWFDEWRAVAKANSGRWVGRIDGVYVDPGSQRFFALATVEGRSGEALALAEIHAKQALGLAAEPFCKAIPLPHGVESATTAMDEVLASQPRCPCSTWEVFAHVTGTTVKVAVVWVGVVYPRFVRRVPERQDGRTVVRVTAAPVPTGADLLPAICERLTSQGRVIAEPFEAEVR